MTRSFSTMAEDVKDARISGELPLGCRSSAGWEAGGILAVDKPEGPTSFAVVHRIKKRLNLKKAGHCGTLDPFATGLLLVCINQATRISDQLLDQDKVYRFGVRFGVETDTLDRTGKVTRTHDGPAPSREELNGAVDAFRGVCLQKVPRYAAVRVEGKRLYELSRKGVEVERPEREVCIRKLELLSYQWPDATFETCCSKGTYVRQLAADMGHRLGCGAHVSELRRLASGPFHVDRAVEFQDVEGEAEVHCWERKLISMNEALAHLPHVLVEDAGTIRRIRDGQMSREWEVAHREKFSGSGMPVRILGADGRLAALWWPFSETPSQRRLRVF